MTRALRRWGVVSLALAVAIPCGTAAFALAAGLDPVLRDALTDLGLVGLFSILSDLADGAGPESTSLALAAFARALFALFALPLVMIALVGETLRWRGLVAYAVGTGVVTALVPWLARGGGSPDSGTAQVVALEGRVTAILFLTGAMSGFIYWLIAGRGASAEPVG